MALTNHATSGDSEERHRRSSERAVWAYITALLLASAVVAWIGTGGDTPRLNAAPWETAGLLALLVAAGALTVGFRLRGDVEAYDLFDASLAPLLFFFPTAGVVLLAGMGQAAANVFRRNTTMKGTFNTAQVMFSAGVGSVMVNLLRDGDEVNVANIGALLLGLLTMTIVQELAFAVVISLAQHVGLRATLSGLRPSIVPRWLGGWAANSAFGIVFTASYAAAPSTIPLFFVPLGLLHWTSRGFAIEHAQRTRLAALQRATHALGEHIDPRDGFPAFLTEVRDCFESESVELVLFNNGQRSRWRIDARGLARDEIADRTDLDAALARRGDTRRILPDDADAELADLLQQEGWRDCIAAPLRMSDMVVGLLRSCNRGGLEGFDEGELAVLEALAREAASALERGGLLSTILEERQTLSEIVGSTSDGIMTLDSDGTVSTWNPGIESVTGYSVDEMVGSRRIPVLRARDGRGADVLLERWADEGVTIPAQIQVTTREGDARWLSCSYARVPGGGGRLPSLVVVARDVTRAYELDRLKDDFVATVSHELRTPLVPIKGFVSTLLQYGDSLSEERRHEALESILRGAQRLEHLVLNLLEVSRVDSSTSIPEPVPVAMSELVATVVADLRQSWPDRSIAVSGPSGPVPALANPLWTEQVLSNLLSNALKYTPRSSPIEVELQTVNGEVRVNVVDHGPGIPDDEMDRIFERWERLHRDDTQAGTGLGLYIARRLTDAMGGRLGVSPTPGGGATFTLTLPSTRHLAAVV